MRNLAADPAIEHASEVHIPVRSAGLYGDLQVPRQARGIVLFAQGSGSGRHRPRNRFVARRLHDKALGTLLLDLVTADEEAIDLATRRLRFDIGLLGARLVDASRWIMNAPATHALSIGYFGASTGGGAALVAAAELGDEIGAVVSRGGRPDRSGCAAERQIADAADRRRF